MRKVFFGITLKIPDYRGLNLDVNIFYKDVDFVCLEKKLIIELDGSQHVHQKSYDDVRTQKLQKEGFKVLRFWNNEVLNNLEGVWEVICHNCEGFLCMPKTYALDILNKKGKYYFFKTVLVE